ncbi:MAG: hypothetical protein ACJ8G1_18345 [Vitreoscilla sp.]|jgi:hypothetical protein
MKLFLNRLLELHGPPWANNIEQSPHLLERFQSLNVDSDGARCRPRSSGFRRAGAIPKVTLDRTIDFRGFPGRRAANPRVPQSSFLA